MGLSKEKGDYRRTVKRTRSTDTHAADTVIHSKKMSDARKEALKKIVEKLGLPATSDTTTAVILETISKLQSKAAELEKLNAVLAKQREAERAELSAASAPYSKSNPHPKHGSKSAAKRKSSGCLHPRRAIR